MKSMILLSDIEGGNAGSEGVSRSQDEGQVDVLGLCGTEIISDTEYLTVTDHVVHTAETQLGHNGSELVCDVVEEVDDMLRCANELLAELRVLSSDTNRASIQLR
jgi:hypothetical protein